MLYPYSIHSDYIHCIKGRSKFSSPEFCVTTTDHKVQLLTVHQVFMLPCNELEKKMRACINVRETPTPSSDILDLECLIFLPLCVLPSLMCMIGCLKEKEKQRKLQKCCVLFAFSVSTHLYETCEFFYSECSINITMKGKAIPLQTWTGPEGSKSLRLPHFKTIAT